LGKFVRVCLLILVVLFLCALGLAVYAWYPSISLAEALQREGLTVESLKKNKENVLVRIYKKETRLDLIYEDKVIKSYRVSTGPGLPEGEKPPEKIGTIDRALITLCYHPGDKQVRGDFRTPEGDYHLVHDFRLSAANYKFALISYPDAEDRRLSSDPGGDIGIHGLHPKLDWLGRLHVHDELFMPRPWAPRPRPPHPRMRCPQQP